jgi:uncharacterized protein YndB with AHSA1/START domain
MRLFVVVALAALASAAQAEVKSAGPVSFEVEAKVVVQASPEAAYDMLTRIGQWWDPDHTWSGTGENLSLEPRAGGCF